MDNELLDEIIEKHQLVMVVFAYDEKPFQVFTKEKDSHFFMFDFGYNILDKFRWNMSGAGLSAKDLYSEHPNMPYWIKSGYKAENCKGSVRLLNLPNKFKTIGKVFKYKEEI